jgi:hypothetical protein
MHDQKKRAAILALHERGHSVRAIARALRISRGAVRDVIAQGTDEVPSLVRPSAATQWREQVLEQYALCNGNLVRVHEELCKLGARFSYPALTAFCRREGIGVEPKPPAGRYHFEPAEEMQHDTSPHRAKIGGVVHKVQTASLVLCHSRMIYIQLYPCFTRFECKVFLTDALQYFGGAARRCMIDNTHVVVLKGSGMSMVPVPEMAAFAERYGFEFRAHEKGDANRSARVEGAFDWVERNFLAGREFRDWYHVNEEATRWCDEKNAAHSPKLHASRRELFAAERPRLVALPIWTPDVYRLHHRIVDAEGYVHVASNRFSVPWRLVGRSVEARETKTHVEIFLGPRLVATHVRPIGAHDLHVTVPEHRPPRGQGRPKDAPPPEVQQLLSAEPTLASYIAALRSHANGRGTLALRRLLRMVRDYPREPLLATIAHAEHYGLFDLDRLERLLLRQIADDYFVLPSEPPKDHDDE